MNYMYRTCVSLVLHVVWNELRRYRRYMHLISLNYDIRQRLNSYSYHTVGDFQPPPLLFIPTFPVDLGPFQIQKYTMTQHMSRMRASSHFTFPGSSMPSDFSNTYLLQKNKDTLKPPSMKGFYYPLPLNDDKNSNYR